ncbi:MAG TPA: multidrug ABC transporter [Spirochaetia bacterium]|nr:multidrug ABC transporter [Spirochaetia bacterium]
MKITEVSVKKPVSMSMIFSAIMAVAIVAFLKLPIDLLPDVSFPTVTVVTMSSGTNPEEVEAKITQPIEESVGTVNNIKKVKSSSVEGMSIVSIEFVWGTDMGEAASDVREKLDLVTGRLPDSAEKPITFKLDTSMFPVYGFVLGGVPLSVSKKFAEDILKPELEQIEGVSMARIEGGRDEQVQILIDRTRLKAYGLSFDEVAKTLALENINQPAGNVKVGSNDFTIRTEGEFKSLDDIKKIVIGVKGKNIKKPVFLQDIASVVKGYADQNEARIVGDGEAVAVICQKQSGSNTVEVVNRILDKLSKMETRMPKGMYHKEIMNGGNYIERSIGNISSSAFYAFLLAVLVVLFFLKNLRSTFIIALAIPISIIVTFLLMYLGNITLNMMSFGGLALGVGMLVDNAIVVLENIYRHRQLGEDRIHSAIKGTKEVAMPITAGTLTTICVFLPLLFVKGVAGVFFKEMALTVTFSLMGSLMVALTLIPMLSSKLIQAMQIGEVKQFRIKPLGFFYKIGELILVKLESRYTRIIQWSLDHRKTVLFSTIGLFILSIMVSGLLQKGFMPESNQDRMNVDIELKEGTRLELTKTLAYQISEKISQVEGVQTFTAVAGTGNNFFAVMQGKTGSHRITGSIVLEKVETGRPHVSVIREKIRKILVDIPGIKVTFYVGSLMSSNTLPVEIQVRGKNVDEIYQTAKKVKAIIDKDFTKELKDTQISRSDGKEELVIKIDRVKASTMGFNVYTIADTVQNNFVGKTATRFRAKGDEVDIVVRLQEDQRLTEKDLKNIILKSPLGFSIPLSQLAEIKKGFAPVKIERNAQEKVVYVSANNAPEVGVANVVETLQQKISNEIVLPEGVSIIYGGSYADTQESFQDLLGAFGLAVLLIFMIMAAQFESFLSPFLILFAIPLSLIGVFFILFLTGTEFTVVVGIGIIILAGIVVNNGIVLLDYIRQLREEHGHDLFSSIIHAGKIRLRPILMTTLTTVIGMCPLAFGGGAGSETQAPMALAIIGGLSISTLFTLIFTPILYSYFQGFIIKRRKRKIKKKQFKLSKQGGLNGL